MTPAETRVPAFDKDGDPVIHDTDVRLVEQRPDHTALIEKLEQQARIADGAVLHSDTPMRAQVFAEGKAAGIRAAISTLRGDEQR